MNVAINSKRTPQSVVVNDLQELIFLYDRAKISRCFENAVQRLKDDNKNPTTHLLHKIKHVTIHILSIL